MILTVILILLIFEQYQNIQSQLYQPIVTQMMIVHSIERVEMNVVRIHVIIQIHVAKVLSVLQKIINQYASAQVDSLEVH